MNKKLRCGLIGMPLGHSYSPEIHALLADYEYTLTELEENEVGSYLKSNRFDATNVTIPYKKTVMPFLDEISPEAERIGSVNTITHLPDGRLRGDNTDYYGFLYNTKRAGISFKDKHVVILGGGATSKTAQTVVNGEGAKTLTVISRSGENNYQTVYSLTQTQIIVNTTPLGTFPDYDAKAVDLSKFPNLEGVVDVVYNPSRTQLILQAESLGVKCVNGLGMLVAQGAKACELFTGQPVPEEKIESAIVSLQKELKNIVLIGMPGSGKSSVAKLLGEKLGMQVVDTDALIEQAEKRSIPDIFATDGEEYFRQKERQVVLSLCQTGGKIISTGGGIILNKQNSIDLKRNGTVYYLDRALDKLARGGRPLSLKDGVETLYENRKDLYAFATDIAVDNNGDITETVKKIEKDFLK
ncbi:MAG: AAA family ATPase [Clostridia bacterium]|nr:AAA family ATPase [Clostridia bacterium]